MEVEEQEIDSDGNVLNSVKKQRKQITTEEIGLASALPAPVSAQQPPSTSYMRDSSRNQLHRLGALYSNPQDLSSPVHRTETAFAVEQATENALSGAKLKKSHRLAELANSINKWEDDIPPKSRSNPLKGDTDQADAIAGSSKSKSNNVNALSGIRSITKSPRKSAMHTTSILSRIESIELKEHDDNKNKNSNNKHLKWDKHIMDSLESQGYKRRDTTTKRLEYDFSAKSPERKGTNTGPSNAKMSQDKRKISGGSGAIPKTDGNRELIPPPKKMEITKGMVSGRAAIFETQRANGSTAAGATANTAPDKNKKDPAEMTLKERMALFEKNKGQALIPKAALGIATSVRQIMADKKPSENIKQVITTPQQPIINSNVMLSVAPSSSKINNFNKATKADTCATGMGIRHTVAKLITAPATISESRIASENRKIREQEMNVVLNRFNQQQQQQSDDDDYDREPATPPPAPPMPENLFKSNSGGRKRLSGKLHKFRGN